MPEKAPDGLTTGVFPRIMNCPGSWGVSGTLYRQSAIAGVMCCLGFFAAWQPFVSDVDAGVLRNRSPRTMSGQE